MNEASFCVIKIAWKSAEKKLLVSTLRFTFFICLVSEWGRAESWSFHKPSSLISFSFSVIWCPFSQLRSLWELMGRSHRSQVVDSDPPFLKFYSVLLYWWKIIKFSFWVTERCFYHRELFQIFWLLNADVRWSGNMTGAS